MDENEVGFTMPFRHGQTPNAAMRDRGEECWPGQAFIPAGQGSVASGDFELLTGWTTSKSNVESKESFVVSVHRVPLSPRSGIYNYPTVPVPVSIRLLLTKSIFY